MRVAVVENTPVTHHGLVGVALHEAAAMVDVFRPRAGDALPDPAAYDGLVVLGGEQAATDDALHPYLPELARRMRGAADAGQPVLGICLGCQILARGCGGENRIGAAREFGWREIAATPAGRADPVLGVLPPRFRLFQWHADTFTLPPGAAHLAESDGALAQAFRFGRAAWGFQFHFEANRAVVADWTRRFPREAEAIAPGWVAAHADEAAAHGAESDAAGLALARAWVRMLG